MRPPYNTNDVPDKLVAFIDILGFKKLVLREESTSLKSINFIDTHIRLVLNTLKKDYGKTFSIKLFSDCMCLSCEYNKENIFYVIWELAYIQFYFSLEGIFLRGALTRGSHFENDRIIFSRGLIRAYEMEQVAKYPRIIIDHELVDQIKSDTELYFPIYLGFTKHEFLMQSPDGLFFVDYLNFMYEEGIEQEDSLKIHKQAILTKVQENYNDIKVIDKFRWLAEYHNFKLNEFIKLNDFDSKSNSELINDVSINLPIVFPQFLKIPPPRSQKTKP